VSRRRWKRAGLVVGICAGGALGGVVGLASAAPSRAVNRQQAPARHSAGTNGRWMSHFPFLALAMRRDTQSRAGFHRLNARLQAQAQSVASERIGRSLRLAADATQETQGPDGWQVAVVPGSDGACLTGYIPNAAGGAMGFTSCETAQSITQYGLVSTGIHGGSGNFLVGMFPSGNSAVSLQTSDGQQTEVPVTNGMVIRDLGAVGARSLSFTNGNGSPTTLNYNSAVAPANPSGQGGEG
jgi:hypothetical protein